MASSRSSHVLGGKGKSKSGGKSGKKPHSIHVRRGHSGGFIAQHFHKPDETGAAQEPEEHVLPDMQSLQDHMASNLGDQGPAPAPAEPNPAQAGPQPQVGLS